MNLVLNPGWTEDKEDRKALLAFRGMEEELCIFNRTQGELGVLIQMSLGAMIASKSELRSESVEDKLSLRYDMMRS
ncbi:hypothetical protein TIFTF001_051968 [Ficus carica]|uniref:Uncharacterized protein n=1 Tax=Ficus carica TaxID=3494 RepID=A0AA88EJM8_FICCA|nr:hypothetical protein TIFTF001_051968 [Ficus carica]